VKDIQNQPDNRRINIKKVGVKNISYPITVLDKAKRQQKTVATVNMYVNLPHQFKGTHMSRFIEILNRFRGEINLKSFHVILAEMKRRLHAEAAHMEIEFPYFLPKKRPHTAIDLGRYICRMHGSLENVHDLALAVQVPINAPLPAQCSDVLPRSPGHWGVADISVRFRRFMWIEDLIDAVEEITGCRDSAKMQAGGSSAIEQPTVESVTKALGERLRSFSDISWFSVRVENFAKDYTTFALLEWPEADNEIPLTVTAQQAVTGESTAPLTH
jgi:GTP cyclohydrolase I